ncbi:MAG: hypothetical protein WAM70_18795 [Pyrinomonadaceae bacterium]
MVKLVSAILILLSVSGVSVLGQQPTAETLSYGDKAAIVETILEVKNHASLRDFPFLPAVSSDNLQFVHSSIFTKHGFTLVSASDIRESKKETVIEYLLFRKISFRDGVAVVILSHVREGRPCFAASMHNESSYTYEVRRTSKGLTATLTYGPMPSFNLKPFASAR